MEPSRTGEWIGDCEVLEALAVGAHGEIVLARKGGLGGELVAVKRLLPELVRKKDAVTAFFDEIRLCTRLVHPNIVRVYRGDVHHGTPYIVMEFVDGVTLWELLEEARDRGLPIPIPVAVHVATMIGEALAYAHTLRDERNRPLRLVHRDVSSVNVMVSFDGAVKLLDFGIARSTIREHETAPGIIRGKPQYLSPEQCGQAEIDHLTDLYSLGVVLFEMLAGRRPYIDDDVYNLIRRILRGDRPALGELRPAVEPELEEIVDRAMAVPRDERYGSARQLVRDLRTYAEGHPSPATTSRLAELVRALFPASRLAEVALRYGPPEATAVDTVMPEARQTEETTLAEAVPAVAATPALEAERGGLLDPPTRQDVVAHAAAEGRRGADPTPAPGHLFDLSGEEDTTTDVIEPPRRVSSVAPAPVVPNERKEEPTLEADGLAPSGWPRPAEPAEEDLPEEPTSPAARSALSSRLVADRRVAPSPEEGPATSLQPSAPASQPRTDDIPPVPPTRTADVERRPADWVSAGRPSTGRPRSAARWWIGVAATIGLMGSILGVVLATCDREDAPAVAEPVASLPFEIVDAGPSPAPAEPEPGTLVVTVRPSGAVVVVGEARVQAEEGVARLELPPGDHAIRVRASGYQHQNLDVHLGPGETTEITVSLERLYGQLSVRSRTKATVYVDGDALGTTPLRRAKVPAGVHTVKVRNGRAEKRRRVRVLAGRHRMVRFPL